MTWSLAAPILCKSQAALLTPQSFVSIQGGREGVQSLDEESGAGAPVPVPPQGPWAALRMAGYIFQLSLLVWAWDESRSPLSPPEPEPRCPPPCQRSLVPGAEQGSGCASRSLLSCPGVSWLLAFPREVSSPPLEWRGLDGRAGSVKATGGPGALERS